MPSRGVPFGVHDIESEFLNIYKSFYQKRKGVLPHITAEDETALKEIVKRFLTVPSHTSLRPWKALLDNWYKLPVYYQPRISLPEIIQNLDLIIELTIEDHQLKSRSF